MPPFGSNAITCAFARRVLYEPGRGFRLSDRIVSALDRFIGALTRFKVPGDGDGVMNRWLFIYPFVGATDWTHALNLADAPNAGFISGGPSGGTGKFDKWAMQWSGNVTHNSLGVTMNSGSQGFTGIDAADISQTSGAAWNRRTHGLYSRTNSAVNARDLSASFTEPRNGYVYFQGMILRYGDGNYYGDLCRYFKSGVPEAGNRVMVAVSDSLGLFADTQRGAIGPTHYFYKRGVYLSGESTGEIGMGYGDPNSGAWLILTGTGRNYAFMFSTRHTKALEGTMNTDGTGGQMPGFNAEFNFFVEQLQVALLRNV